MSEILIEYLKKEKVSLILDSLPTAVFVTDKDGRLKFYNSAMTQLLGNEPELDSECWYGNSTLYHPDGTHVKPHENPVASFFNEEAGSREDGGLLIVERSKGERILVKLYSSWLYTEEGERIGAIYMLTDITEQKKTEKGLEDLTEKFSQKERLYEAIISSTPDLIYVFDLDYRFIFANDALLEMWGLDEDEYFGKGLREIGYEEWHAEMHERELDQVIATKEPVQGEVSFPHAKLGMRVYEYLFVPVLNKEDEVEAVAGTTRDITRRKEAEKALRRNEEKYRTLVENFPNGAVALFDRDLRYTAVGGTLVDTIGIDPVNRVGSKIHDLYPDDIIDEIESHFHAVLDGEANRFELEYHNRHMIAQTLPIQDDGGEVVAGMIVVLDITERWEAQEALRKSEEKYRSLFESMNEGFAVIQMEFDENDEPVNFRFLETNTAYQKHTGLKQKVKGKTARDVFPDLGEDLLRRDGRVALTGEPFHGEIYVDEVDRWLDLSVFRIGEPEERKVAVLFTDITERKRAQNKLERMNEKLEERVEERTQSLLTYQDQLRSLAYQLSRTEEKQRQQLATELHDNLGQMLALGKMKINELEQGESAEDIASVVDELKKLMDDAIRYTRELTSDLKPPSSVSNDFRASLNWLTEKIAEHGLTVTIDDDEKPKSLEEEVRTTVIQSIRELLFNVIKHTSEKKAIVRLRRREEQLQIVVEDEGEGFDTDNNALASAKEGRFGLFNIYERIDLLGGRVDMETQKGRGTKVTLYVPLSGVHSDDILDQDEKEQLDKTEPRQARQDEKTKILLVDDHKMFRNGLRKIIEEEDDMIVIGEADNGEDALTLCHKTSPDVILMDVSMPKMDGIEATKRIKADMPDVRIIGVSLHDSQEVIQDIRSAGASAYLPKTEAFESLIMTIRAEASATKA